MNYEFLLGNNLETLKTLADNSVDSVITDPPYGLSFMNKKWDYDVPSIELWKEVYRVLKPGGHLLSFGGTRTYHRMVVNIEDAGFEIRDQIMWLYGSGFPKSLNIGKAIDKVEGNEREEVDYIAPDGKKRWGGNSFSINEPPNGRGINKKSKGQSEGEGWGTGLKPANEPICVARKPISENTIADNFIKWGVGGINIDECRVGSEVIKSNGYYNTDNNKNCYGEYNENFEGGTHQGRFPANLILECTCDEVIKGEKGQVKYTEFPNKSGWKNTSETKFVIAHNDKGDIHTNPECPCRLLDEQSGQIKSSKIPAEYEGGFGGSQNTYGKGIIKKEAGYSDSGGASRFFYVAKTSKSERNMGLDNFEEKVSVFPGLNSFDNEGNRLRADGSIIPPLVSKNNHPTVKPVNLMYYLCKLITPKGGVILDPYMGSGSTGIAALLGEYTFIGCEMDVDYFEIARTRIINYEKYKKFLKK